MNYLDDQGQVHIAQWAGKSRASTEPCLKFELKFISTIPVETHEVWSKCQTSAHDEVNWTSQIAHFMWEYLIKSWLKEYGNV